MKSVEGNAGGRSAPCIALFLLLCSFLFLRCAKDGAGPLAEPLPFSMAKSNPMQVYVHYMPWFKSKEYSGAWGLHWTMRNQNPDRVLPNGNREIASHYYPLIGPYDSADPDVIDYHLLLMKYAGLDGILIDWYGSHNVLDYGVNLENTREIVKGAERVGIRFAIVYEDASAAEAARLTGGRDLEAARADLRYAEQAYFSKEAYLRVGNRPLCLVFGPRQFKDSTQWKEVLGGLSKPVALYPLWGFSKQVGTSLATGEFAWIDFKPGFEQLAQFYASMPKNTSMGAAFPGFHDFYEPGGWGSSYGFIDHRSGATLRATLDKARTSGISQLQLVTWNDFGEGTVLEPTQEFGFSSLETIQAFTGVRYTKADLETIHRYYLKRKELKGNVPAQQSLDVIFQHLVRLDMPAARNALDRL